MGGENLDKKMQQPSRRSFLKEVGAGVIGGTAVTQALHYLSKPEAPTSVVASPAEQVSKITHFAQSVKDVIEQNKEHIIFNAETGALRVVDGKKVLYDSKKGAQPQRVRAVSVTITPDNYALTFTYTYATGGETIEINNIYGGTLKVGVAGWIDASPKK